MVATVTSHVLVIVTATACATPADVTANHERNVQSLRDSLANADATYRTELATAETWDQHVLGIPASGWVPILVFGLLLVAVLLTLAGREVVAALNNRRKCRHALELAREETRRVATNRGPCPSCGRDYLSADDVRRMRETDFH